MDEERDRQVIIPNEVLLIVGQLAIEKGYLAQALQREKEKVSELNDLLVKLQQRQAKPVDTKP